MRPGWRGKVGLKRLVVSVPIVGGVHGVRRTRRILSVVQTVKEVRAELELRALTERNTLDEREVEVVDRTGGQNIAA